MGPTKNFAIENLPAEIVPSNGQAVIVAPTPNSILEMAVRQGANVETLTQLLALQERWEANEARKAFEVAFAAFKAEAPKLEKTKQVAFKETKYKYTPLDEITKAVNPVLAKHGLSYNWKQESTKDTITVTCVLRHVQGYSIENSLSGPHDPSGSKNAIQALGSGVHYLRRYTVLGVLGMATSDEDSDGVTNNEAADFVALIEDSRTIDELKKHYTEAVADGLKKQSSKAVALYMAARQKRETELRA